MPLCPKDLPHSVAQFRSGGKVLGPEPSQPQCLHWRFHVMGWV